MAHGHQQGRVESLPPDTDNDVALRASSSLVGKPWQV